MKFTHCRAFWAHMAPLGVGSAKLGAQSPVIVGAGWHIAVNQSCAALSGRVWRRSMHGEDIMQRHHSGLQNDIHRIDVRHIRRLNGLITWPEHTLAAVTGTVPEHPLLFVGTGNDSQTPVFRRRVIDGDPNRAGPQGPHGPVQPILMPWRRFISPAFFTEDIRGPDNDVVTEELGHGVEHVRIDGVVEPGPIGFNQAVGKLGCRGRGVAR